MKELFQLPQMLTLDGREVTESMTVNEASAACDSGGMGCEKGCTSGCSSGCGGGGGGYTV